MKQILTIILFFSLSGFASAQNLNAGPDQTITAGQSVQLNGQASTSNIKWFTNGTGSFNNRNILNAIYYPSAADISNGQVKLRLVNRKNPAIKDIMKVTILPSCPNISVNAGADVVQCGYGYGEVQLDATVDNNNNGMLWTSSGFGFFEDETSAITTYYYDQTDVDYAFINLTATAFNDPGCPESSDYLSLNLQAAPYLEFPNPFVYATSENPVLYLSVYRYGYASSGTWTSSGSGTFDDANSDYPSYTASPQDIINGYLSFTYTTNDPIGPCGPTSGTMEGYIEFIPTCPEVSIYPSSDTICGSDFGGVYDLFANITGTDYYIQWTSDGQGFFFDETNASTAYEYTSGDAGFGGVNLTCNVYDASGYCSPVSSSFYLKLNDPARIDLNDFGYEACGDQPIFIDGNISGFANTVYWSTSGTGTFSPNPGSSTEYFPSIQDRMNGYISISGITNDPVGPCGASGDFTEIYFNGPYVDAGLDIVVCGYPYGGSIPLSAARGNNTYNTTWTTDGFGYFDDETNPNTNYNYDGTDVDYAFINLTITASGFGLCPDVSDVVTVNLQAAPYLEFPEPVVYTNSDNPILYVSVYRYGYASSGTWTSSGTGYFSDPTADYSAYYASQSDINNGSVYFTFTTNDPAGPCGPTSGYMEGYIYYVPTCPTISFASSNDAICGYDFGGGYDLNALITGSDYYTIWSTTGSGYLYDDPNNPSNVYYEYSPGDVGSFGITITCSVYDNAGYCAANAAIFSLGIDDPARIDLSDFGYYACGDQSLFIDNPISGTATTVYWTTSGTGYFSPNPSSSPQYFPSFQDRFFAGVSITGTTNDPAGVCPLANDFSDIFLNGAVVDAGADIVECGYEFGGSIPLNASLGNNAYGVTWSTSGSGYFDDEFSTSAIYNYDANDVNNAFVNLTATVSGNGCSDYSDVVTVNLQAAPALVFPEPYVYTCIENPIHYVNVYRYGYASSGTWTSSGTGFFDNPASDYAAYYSSQDDVFNGVVYFTFTSNDPDGPCTATSGTIEGYYNYCGGGGAGDLIQKPAEEVFNKNSIQLFPNPTNNMLNIISVSDVDYSNTYITDLTGKIINCNWEGKNINVSLLQSGIYFLHVGGTTGIEVLKFIKQ